jgi:hypothetical protein
MPKAKEKAVKLAAKEKTKEEVVTEAPVAVEKPIIKVEDCVGKKIGGKKIVSCVNTTLPSGKIYNIVTTEDQVTFTLSSRDVEEQVK